MSNSYLPPSQNKKKNSYLPSDLLVLVLIRLPAKSLGRCKCVSKSWNVLISSSELVHFHLQYQSSIRKKLYRLLAKEAPYSNPSHETHLAEYSINIGQDLELGCEIQRVYNPYESHIAPGMTSTLVGSCNGLICQTLSQARNARELTIYGEYEISLCNPLTKTSWVLPKSLLFLKDGGRRRVVFYGFGYDDVHDTYKVFLASGPPHDECQWQTFNQRDAKYEYEVYSLRSNKWMIVRPDLDFHDYFIHCIAIWNLDGVLINCALHWILRNYRNRKMNHILAFDLRVDKHNILPLPEAAEQYKYMSLNVLNGCLLLSDKTLCFKRESFVDMWLMKDYGLKDSWTRISIRNSQYSLFSITPLTLLDDNHNLKRKIIYHDTWRSNSSRMILLYYDIESHQVVKLPTPPSAVSFHNPKQHQFVASLVQPHPPFSG